MARVLVPLAEGCEEVEAVTVVDLLRRAGIDVVTASLGAGAVRGSHGITIMADETLDVALKRDYDMVVLPGGLPGSTNLEADARVNAIVKKMANGGKFVGAICAAPVVLAKAGLLKGKRATSYPGFVDKLGLPDVTYTGAAVECDGKVITSRGPGTAMDFALAIIEKLQGKAKRDTIEKALVRA